MKASSSLACKYNFLMNNSVTPPLLVVLVVVVLVLAGSTVTEGLLMYCASVVRFADQTSLNLWSTIRYSRLTSKPLPVGATLTCFGRLESCCLEIFPKSKNAKLPTVVFGATSTPA